MCNLVKSKVQLHTKDDEIRHWLSCRAKLSTHWFEVPQPTWLLTNKPEIFLFSNKKVFTIILFVQKTNGKNKFIMKESIFIHKN